MNSCTFSSIARVCLVVAPAVLEWFRMTADALKDCNKKHLAQMAKEQGSPAGTRCGKTS